MRKEIRPALVLLGAFTLITGFVYPAVVTAIAKAVFPVQAEGSLIERDGRAVGSLLIGQTFTSPQYFWGRPSATGPMPHNAAASSGSNQGPLHPALADALTARIAALKAADPEQTAPIPVDLVTASGSGLDPHISPAAAAWQAPRVARAQAAAGAGRCADRPAHRGASARRARRAAGERADAEPRAGSGAQVRSVRPTTARRDGRAAPCGHGRPADDGGRGKRPQ
jgi:K+-transporting ATPase ATPase C chain